MNKFEDSNNSNPYGIVNLGDLGDSLYDEPPKPLTPEPYFSKNIKNQLYRQAGANSLSNPQLWNEIESKWNSALAAAEQYGEQIEYTDETVAHEYWYREILTPEQQDAYPHLVG